MSYFLYAETAFHHEGDFNYMIGLIDAAKSSGAQGLKFQVLIDYDSFIARSNPGYDDFKRAMFSVDEWIEILNHTRKQGLKIVFMPCDLKSIELLERKLFQADYLDLHSVSFYDEEVHDQMKKTGLPIIIGVGGRTLEEMRKKLEYFGNQIWCFMVGFQSFPTNLADVKLPKIAMMLEEFPNVKIGYADHSHYDSIEGVQSNLEAYDFGARVFEKHLSLREGEERFDHIASVSPDKFASINDQLNGKAEINKTVSFDASYFELSDAEKVYRNRQKVAVAKKDLPSGKLLTEQDVAFKMAGNVEGLVSLDQLLNKSLKQELKYDEPILASNLLG